MKFSLASWFSIFFFGVSLLATITLPVLAEPPADVHTEQEVNPKPELKKPIKIKFPSALRKKITTGEIVIQFIVTKTGTVSDLSVVRFSDPDMVAPVITAYETAQYNPGLLKGEPVNVRMDITVPYPLK